MNLKELVKLPDGEDVNEFIGEHVIDFYDRLFDTYDQIAFEDDQLKSKYDYYQIESEGDSRA